MTVTVIAMAAEIVIGIGSVEIEAEIKLVERQMEIKS